MATTSKTLAGLIAGALATALLGACGGGGGGSTSTAAGAGAAPVANLAGVLNDAPVAGARYFTSSGSGGCTSSAPCTTNAQGQFNYAAGDAVTFTAAGVTLGTTSTLQPAADGSTTVTPVSLVSGATLPTDPGPTAIAQFLQTLNSVAASTTGSGAPGVLMMPSDAATTGKLATALSNAGITSASSVTTATLQTAMNTAFGANQITVVPASTATATLTEGVNSSGFIGTVWSGTCTCGGGATIYFQPGGALTGFTADGELLAGSWAGSTTAGGGVTVQASASGGGYGTGTIPANSNSGTVTVYSSTGVQKGTLTFNKVVSAAASTATQYLGGWYATYTPNATGLAAGDSGGTAYIIAAADGTLYGITDGSSAPFQGTWSTANGQGSASWTENSKSITIAIDLSSGTGTVTVGGQTYGTISFSRTGTLTRKNNQTSTASSIPLALNVVVSWANGSTTVSSLALGVNVFDGNGALIASGVKPESTSLRTDWVRTTTTDSISVPYPQGVGSTFSLSVGPANCTISGATGTINDANSGNASAYPTVYVTCDPSAAAPPPVPLLLNVTTTWGTVYPMPGYGLALIVKDASGSQIASGFVQQNVNLIGSDGVVRGTTTTTNIAASYTPGTAASYTLTTGLAYCTITAGGSGSVVDASAGNASAYPTVAVACQ